MDYHIKPNVKDIWLSRLPKALTKGAELEGRIYTLYQIKEDELILDSLLVLFTQVADSDASIPQNGLSTNLEISAR